MALQDRTYWRDDQQGGGAGGFGATTLQLPKPARVVKILLLINLGAFVGQLLMGFMVEFRLSRLLGATVDDWWQLWRYVTFQFLHSPYNLWHLGLNMLGLYMFGSPLERHWGGRKFLKFYLSCGVFAGLLYVVVGALLANQGWVPLVGASGGVYGILLACAVLFPNFRIILFLFPVPIRLGAILIFGAMGLTLLMSLREGAYGGSFWSDVAHLGGAGMAAMWLWVLPRARRTATGAADRVNEGAWQRKMKRRADEQKEIDRILQKIHDSGIASLTGREKRLLQNATRRQKKRENDLTRL